MHDPFFLPPVPALSRAVQPLADRFGLVTLPLHIHEVLYATLFYTAIQLVVSPFLTRLLVPQLYASMSRARRANWDAHVVSLIQSTLINVLALYYLSVDRERVDMGAAPADWRGRIFGYTGASGLIQSLAAGYFVWDLILTLAYLDVFGLGLLAHAVSALTVYTFGYRPFLNYYASNFILYELSTPFLNAHWFFDKLDKTGSRAQLYNGIVLICTFFSCRLVYGNYMSVWVYRDMWHAVWEGPGADVLAAGAASAGSNPFAYAADAPIPVWLFLLYIASNLTLNSLNVLWFFKMIAAVRRRFTPGAAKPAKAKIDKEPVALVVTGNHVLDDAAARLRIAAEKLTNVEDDLTEVQ